jgi:hydrogenase/urease accessory protein HupE
MGMVHPLSTPPQLLALLALGLMLGQSWPRKFSIAWLIFALAAAIGLIVGNLGYGLRLADPALLIIAFAAALLAAVAPSQLLVPGMLLAGAGGLFLGVVSTPDPGPLRATIITIAGTYVGANLALLYSSGGIGWLRQRFDQPWARIGLRVIAAWIAAISCLMLALSVVL